MINGNKTTAPDACADGARRRLSRRLQSCGGLDRYDWGTRLHRHNLQGAKAGLVDLNLLFNSNMNQLQFACALTSRAPAGVVHVGLRSLSLSAVPTYRDARLCLAQLCGHYETTGLTCTTAPHVEKLKQVAYQDMTAKIAINRPELHNAFRPITVNEMRRAMDLAQDDRCVSCRVCSSF